jgi:predicted kinase
MITIVAGLPGSGKSYFAEKLADRLRAAYINSDRVRQCMRASGNYSLQDKMSVYKEMTRQTRTLAREKKSVVVDATFYRQAMRDLFSDMAKDESGEVRFIEVVADEALIRERLRKPRIYSEADFSVYERVKDEFEEITAPHLKLQSTDENIASMLNRAVQYLSNGGK